MTPVAGFSGGKGAILPWPAFALVFVAEPGFSSTQTLTAAYLPAFLPRLEAHSVARGEMPFRRGRRRLKMAGMSCISVLDVWAAWWVTAALSLFAQQGSSALLERLATPAEKAFNWNLF